jgi:zinc transporter, ZIP family
MTVGLVAAAVSGLATSLGALPFVFVRAVPRRVYDGILGLGAGLMMAAATLGLLSEAVHDVRAGGAMDWQRLGLVVLGFIAGVAVATVMDRFIPHHHAGGHHQHLGHEPGHDVHDPPEHDRGAARRGYAVVGALTLHRIPEGLAIGAGFAAPGSAHLGLLLAVAVGVQNVCEGLVMAAPLRAGGVSGGSGLLIVATTGLAIPAAAVLGGLLAGLAAPLMPFILALAGGTLIYITSNEIIPESHSHGHEGTASAGVVLGFLLTMVLQAILH